jgi:hypothetical protein
MPTFFAKYHHCAKLHKWVLIKLKSWQLKLNPFFQFAQVLNILDLNLSLSLDLFWFLA